MLSQTPPSKNSTSHGRPRQSSSRNSAGAESLPTTTPTLVTWPPPLRTWKGTASGRSRTVGDLVATAFAAAGVDPEGRIVVNPEFVRPPEATLALGDPRLARERLGWEPEVSFEAMIAEMVEHDLALLRTS